MIVVDTNILAYFYLAGERTGDAVALMNHDREWAAPKLWRSEFRNLLGGHFRRGTFTFDGICGVQAAAESLLESREYDVDSKHVLQLVRDSDCTAYDCEFVALAMQLGTRLVTADKKLIRSFPDHAQPLLAA